MIEIKIDLVPFGIKEARRKIGFIKIWNDGTGTRRTGNYGYAIVDEFERMLAEGRYEGFERKNGIFKLVQEILNEAI